MTVATNFLFGIIKRTQDLFDEENQRRKRVEADENRKREIPDRILKPSGQKVMTRYFDSVTK